MYTFGIKHTTADNMTTMLQGSQVGPTPTFFFDYSVKDLRRDVTCCPFQWTKGVQTLQSFKSWSFGKLRYEWTNRMIPTGNDDGINRQYMRYADIVLMRAELENELNGPAAAAPYLTKIRNRAFCYLPTALQKLQLMLRRHLKAKRKCSRQLLTRELHEFAGELIRKADLIRWGMLKSKMDEKKIR